MFFFQNKQTQKQTNIGLCSEVVFWIYSISVNLVWWSSSLNSTCWSLIFIQVHTGTKTQMLWTCCLTKFFVSLYLIFRLLLGTVGSMKVSAVLFYMILVPQTHLSFTDEPRQKQTNHETKTWLAFRRFRTDVHRHHTISVMWYHLDPMHSDCDSSLCWICVTTQAVSYCFTICLHWCRVWLQLSEILGLEAYTSQQNIQARSQL